MDRIFPRANIRIYKHSNPLSHSQSDAKIFYANANIENILIILN